MTRPTDHHAGNEDRREDVELGLPQPRKQAKVTTGFREVVDEPVPPPRVLGIRKPANSKDRHNLVILIVALSVALVMFAILEIKQFRDAAREPQSTSLQSSGER